MNANTAVILLICAIGLGSIQPTSAQAQSQADQTASFKNTLAAYNAKCSGVTVSQAVLYQQCAADKAKLDSQQKSLSSSSGQIPLQMRGGNHGGGNDD
ncbi:MAG TPA: hypothetical protein VMQ63_04990 [Stellaceae bacterium]|jgi:hypothetical protein|nr:hypothetical protein [Stellaceae bacterium]